MINSRRLITLDLLKEYLLEWLKLMEVLSKTREKFCLLNQQAVWKEISWLLQKGATQKETMEEVGGGREFRKVHISTLISGIKIGEIEP